MTVSKYECNACGWIYPPQSDNSAENIVDFKKLPADFNCPLCGVDKSEFSLVNEANTQQSLSASSANKLSDMVVIIGAGLAGWAVADAIRAKNKNVGITMVTADSGARYHKPMLSVAFSQNKTTDDLIRATGDDASKKADIRLLSYTKVLAIVSDQQIVKTDQGNIRYDSLVMAIGAQPAIPRCFDSLDTNDIWHINDIGTFDKIQQALNKETDNPKHIAVIGAGMVGTEIAEDLKKSGHKISLIDMNEAPLALMLPPIATAEIRKAIGNQGIEFIGRSIVDKVESLSGGGYQLLISNCDGNSKRSIEVDHILISTGLKVDPTLPVSAGLKCDPSLGVSVKEETLQTEIPNIFAIGDCMSIGNSPCRYVAPLRAQASCIADYIIGKDNPEYIHQSYQHKPPMIRLKNKSISVSATGNPIADETYGKWKVFSEEENDTQRTLELKQLNSAGDVLATATLKVTL